jgi:acyl-coenzyme A synthetase/AMP-(fatty) acid ligase/thioesterase domain-containing protein/acyl carrier protein
MMDNNDQTPPILYTKDYQPFPEEALHGTFVERFEGLVDLFPDHLALNDRSYNLTYRELNAASNLLAWQILEKRGDRSERVAFFAGHNATSIITLWGILKSGRTYVALNPFFPTEKNHSLIVDLEIDALVTSSQYDQLASQLLELMPDLPVIDSSQTKINRSDNPGLLISPSIPPYIGYTSGTTGKPKIIIHSTASLMEQQLQKNSDYGLCPTDHWALLNPLSFGGGNFGLYGALLNGGTVCMYDIQSRGLSDIPAWVNEQNISIINLAPPVFRNIFGSLEKKNKFPSTRLIILSGDTMISRDVEITKNLFDKNCILSNMLAITEVGIVARHYINFETPPERVVPVGQPFKGLEVEIVDENGVSVPPMQTGEIKVRTLFAATIIESGIEHTDRYTCDSKTGMYTMLTGDLGRLMQDGMLEHLGRIDNVVKINGLRIEFGEIEASLYQHPLVMDAVVQTSKSDKENALRLVAYLCLKPGQQVSQQELHDYLGQLLPYYMIPQKFMILERLPLNSNGKIDRQQLPEPVWDGSEAGQGIINPRTDLERKLVDIWRESLPNIPIGIMDNFFYLGGSSLQALQMLAAIEIELGPKYPLQTLVDHPTIEALAQLIENTHSAQQHRSIILLREDGDKPGIFFVPGGARSAISVMATASLFPPGHLIYSLEYPGMEGYLESLDRIEDLASFFIDQILSVQPSGPYYLAGFCLGGIIAFEMARQLKSRGLNVGFVAVLDSHPGRFYDTPQHRGIQYYLKRVRFLLTKVKSQDMVKQLFKNRSRTQQSKLFQRKDSIASEDTAGDQQDDFARHLKLDESSLKVFNNLLTARGTYRPKFFNGHGLIISSSISKGTFRNTLWKDLFKDHKTYFIPDTTHATIFSNQNNLQQIADLIYNYILEQSN